MAVRYETVTVPLVGGVDTKTDGLMVEPPQLADLRNGRFNKRRAITPRPLFRALPKTARDEDGEIADVAEARALLGVQDSMWLLDGKRALSWSPNQRSWQDGGACDVLTARVTGEGGAFDGQRGMVMATAAGRTLYGYTRPLNIGHAVFFSLRDDASGAWVFYDKHLVDADAPTVLAVAVGENLWLIHLDASDNLVAEIIGPTAVVSSVQLAAAADVYQTDLAPNIHASEIEGHGVVAVWQSAVDEIQVGTWNAIGDVLEPAVTIAAGDVTRVAVAADNADPARSIGVVWTRDEASDWVQVQIFARDLSAVTAIVDLDTAAHPAGFILAALERVACAWEPIVAPRRLRVWYTGAVDSLGGLLSPTTKAGSVNVAGTVVTGAVWSRHAVVACTPWVSGEAIYVPVWMGEAYAAQRAPYVMLRDQGEDAAVLVGAWMSGASGLEDEFGTGRAGSLGLASVDGDRRRVPFARIGLDFEKRFSVVEFDHAPSQGAIATDDGYLSGAVVQRIDEAGPTELGFLAYPAVISAVTSNGLFGQLTPSAEYVYTFYFGWEDEDGRYERSTFGESVAVTLGPLDDTVTFTLASLPHTRKRDRRGNIRIEAYRTLANQPTAERYRVSGVALSGRAVYQDPTLATVTFVDTEPDSVIAEREQDEAQTGLLPPFAPPPSTYLLRAKQRLWGVSAEFENTVWCSVLDVQGRRAAATPALVVRVPSGTGRVTALAQLNENIVVFTERRIYLVAGEGPDNTGTSGEFSAAQIVSSAWGCVDPRSIVQTEAGVYFRSARGTRLLSPSFQVMPVGHAVEAYDGQEVVSADVYPGGEEVLFLAPEGRLLLHDYGVGQWATWDPIAGVDACVFDGRYHYAGADGTVYEEIADGDDLTGAIPYDGVLELGWLTFGTKQGLQLIRRVGVLGRYLGPHVVQVRPAYDYVDVFAPALAWDPSPLHGSGPLGGDVLVAHQVVGQLARTKCQAIKLQICFTPVGASRGMALSDVTLEVARRRGMAKLGAGNTR